MRATTLLRLLSRLQPQKTAVGGFELTADHGTLYLDVKPTTRRLRCGVCERKAAAYDHREREWRHTDLGETRVVLRCRLARVSCARCGVTTQSVLTNAIKHGGGFEGACDIEVGLQPHTDGFDLWVCDAGPGFTLPASRGSLGLQLIQGLTRQLGARFSNSVRSESARATVRLSLRRRPSSSVVPTG